MVGFDSFDWDNVPAYYPDGRSKVPFADPDPEGTAQMWIRLGALREAREAAEAASAKAAEGDDEANAVIPNYEPVVVHQPAEEFDDPIKPLAGFVKLGHENGWELLSLARALSTAKGKPYSSGEREGQPRPDYDIDTQWVHLRKLGVGKVSICFTIINGAVRGNRTTRLFNGVQMSDADMKKVLRGTYVLEAEDAGASSAGDAADVDHRAQ